MNTVAVSPYHLTTRDTPAMAALLLAGRVCTLLPVPLDGENIEALREALHHAPRYRRLLNNWLALAPLFDAGVIVTLSGGKDPGDSARAAAQRIDAEEPWDPIRQFNRQGLFSDSEQYLDAFSADLLKGGPDPGISLPVCAGLDAFAAEQSMPVFRAGHPAGPINAPGSGGVGGSLAQQMETRLGEPLFSVGLPILKQAGPKAILAARKSLKPQLDALRSAVEVALLNPSAAAGQAVRKAGAAYTEAFKSSLADRLNRDDEGGRRLVPGFVSLAARRVSADATLISSVAAFNRASGAGQRATQTLRAPAVAPSLVTLTTTPLDVLPL